jgi:hypothetical protein
MAGPCVYYAEHRLVEPWMIYRFLVSDLSGIAACLIFCASFLADRMVAISLGREVGSRKTRWTRRFFESRWYWLLPVGSTGIGVALVLSSVIQRLHTGGTNEHWSRYAVMTFWMSTALILTVTRVMDYLLSLVAERVAWLQGALPIDFKGVEPEREAVEAFDSQHR